MKNKAAVLPKVRRAIVRAFAFLWFAMGNPVADTCAATMDLGGKEYELLAPSDEVMAIINNVTEYSGTVMNFDVWRVEGYPNVLATIGRFGGKQKRIVVYGSAFLDDLAVKANSGWAKVAVIAHEIGHHANGHYILGAETPAIHQEMEAQADEFAGWVLAMMGAPLTECLRMWDYLPDPLDPVFATHPPRARRKAAVTNGWYRAQHLRNNKNPSPDFGTTCPLIKLDSPGMDLRRYEGTIGASKAKVALVWSADRTISGHCELTDEKGGHSNFDLKGRKEVSIKNLAVADRLHLDGYRGCLIVGQMEADMSPSLGYECLDGKVKRADGTEHPVRLRGVLPLASSTYYRTLPEWGRMSKDYLPPRSPMDWSKILKEPSAGGNAPGADASIDFSSVFKNLPQSGKAPVPESPKEIDWAKILRQPSSPPFYLPPPKKDTVGPAQVSTIGGYDSAWLCVTSIGTPYTSQRMITRQDGGTSSNRRFPAELIDAEIAKGGHLSHLTGDGGGWSVIMSKGGPITDQKILGPRKLPDAPALTQEVATYGAAGYRVTAVGGFLGSWAMVLSRGTKLGAQLIQQTAGEWPEAWVREQEGRGFRITAMAGSGQGSEQRSWLLVMSRDSGLGEQVWSSGTDFPRDWIAKNWKAGYRITAASGYNGWRVIMSKDTGLSFQSHSPVSRDFPSAYVMKEWAGER